MAAELTDDVYKRLDSKKVLSSEAGLLLRVSIVVCAALASLGCAGLVFGFSAIYPVLLEHGVFRDVCIEGQAECEAQDLELATMFTIGTTAVNLWCLPGGFVLDKLGPKLSAMSSCLQVFVGCFCFALGGPGPARWLYYAGFLLLGIGGPSIFVSTVSFSSLFPRFPGLVTAFCVGCFDASSFVFYMLAGIITSGVPFEWVFEGYSVVPCFFAICALLLWPHEPVLPVEEEDDEKDSAGESFYSLQHLSLKQQVMSSEFCLVAYAVSAHMLMLNFFIGTADAQLREYDPASEQALNKAFSLMLPAGGIVWIPLVGCVVDRCSVAGSWLVLWVASCGFMLTLFAYSVYPQMEATAYLAFTFFSFSRPLLYTITANFTGHMFGFQTFGTTYGLIFSLAGTFNSLVAVLKTFAQRSGYQAVNGVIFAMLLMAAAFPTLLFLRNKAKRRRFAEMDRKEQHLQAFIRSPSRRQSFTMRSGVPPSPTLTGSPRRPDRDSSINLVEEHLPPLKI